MRYFAKVVEVGNMTKAAAMLHVAQPALGLQIRQLEEALGTPLLTRHSRGVEVTPAGQLLYERAVAILRMIEDTEAEVKTFGQTRRETLTLGLTHSTMRLVGSELLIAAKRDIPDMLLSLVEEPSIVLVKGLETGELDLALTYEVSEKPAITHEPMLVEELLLVTLPGNAAKQGAIALVDALEYELVLASERDPIRRMVERQANELGRSVKVAYEVQSLLASRQVVRDGLAASILPYGTVADELRDGRLVSRRIERAPLKRTLHLARAAHRSPLANEVAVRRLIRSVVKQLAIDLGPLAERLDQA